MSSLNCLIGEIVSGFVRTDFLISQIVYELQLTGSRTAFFADIRTRQKFNDIKSKISKSVHPKKSEFIELLDQLDAIREKRNVIVHSLVLSEVGNDGNFSFHNYQQVRQGVVNKTEFYTLDDLEGIRDQVVSIHNAFYILHFE